MGKIEGAEGGEEEGIERKGEEEEERTQEGAGTRKEIREAFEPNDGPDGRLYVMCQLKLGLVPTLKRMRLSFLLKLLLFIQYCKVWALCYNILNEIACIGFGCSCLPDVR